MAARGMRSQSMSARGMSARTTSALSMSTAGKPEALYARAAGVPAACARCVAAATRAQPSPLLGQLAP